MKKATSPAPGGLTGCWKAQFAGTIHRRVGGGVGLGVGGLWTEDTRAMRQLPIKMLKIGTKGHISGPGRTHWAGGLNLLVVSTGELGVVSVWV